MAGIRSTQSVVEGQALSLTLSGSDPDGDALTYTVSGNPAGSTLSGTTFTWTPGTGAAGSYTVTFTVSDGKGGSDSKAVTVTVTKVVQAPAMSVLPSALNFGSVAIGQSKTLTLVVTNGGTGSLRVVNIVASSNDVTVSKTGFSLAAGAEEVLTVTLQPSQVGSFSETLDLPSNDPSQPLFQVALRATIVSGGSKASLSLDVTEVAFGQVEIGETSEFNLPVRNAGSGALIVSNVVSDNTQVVVSPSTLNVSPQETKNLLVRFRPLPGRERSGRVTLFSNDAAQPQVKVNWSASEVKSPYLQVTSVQPADAGFGVKTDAELQLSFSEPLYSRRGYTALDIELRPEPLSGPIVDDLQVRGDGRTVVIPVQLARNTVYRLVVYGATGRSGLEMFDILETTFSTGTSAPVLASLSGRVVVEGQSLSSGSVYLFDAASNLVSQSNVALDNSFELAGIAEGSYTLYVDGSLGDGRVVSGSYDRTGDGIADVVTVKGGANQTDLQIVPVVLGGGTPVVSSTNPVEVDLDSTAGNQKLNSLSNVKAGQTVVLEVYGNGVEQLTGAAVTVLFDTSKVSFAGAEEGVGLLKQNGGVTLYLTHLDPLASTVEFGGAIMGPTTTTAVSGSGLLGRFRFKTMEGFTGQSGLKVIRVSGNTLAGRGASDLTLVAALSAGAGGQTSGTQVKVTVGTSSGSGGATVVVPISVDQAKGIAGGDMTVTYDAKVLTATKVQGGDLLTAGGITVIPNLATAGKVQVSMAGVNGLAAGSGVLLQVTFDIKAGAAVGSTPLGLEASLSDENGVNIPVTAVSGSVTVANAGLVGDVNDDKKVSSADAILVLRYSAGLAKLSEVQVRAGDVNDDKKTNSADAILILRKSAGLLAQFPRAGKEATGEVEGLIRIGLAEQTGSGWVVPVVLAAGVAGADLQVRWEEDGVQISQVEGPEDALVASGGTGAGRLRLAVARETAAGELVLQVHLEGEGAAPGLVLLGQVYDEGGEVLGEVEVGAVRPVGVVLGSYPNPFNASTMLRYELAQAGQVELRIYDVSGALVRKMVSQWQGAGRYEIAWDGRNEQGVGVGSGLYLACLDTRGLRHIQKLMLLK